jgi:hypothetical protein
MWVGHGNNRWREEVDTPVRNVQTLGFALQATENRGRFVAFTPFIIMHGELDLWDQRSH